MKKAVQIGMPYSTMYPTAIRDESTGRYVLNATPLVKSETPFALKQEHLKPRIATRHHEPAVKTEASMDKVLGQASINGSK